MGSGTWGRRPLGFRALGSRVWGFQAFRVEVGFR